MQVVRQSRHFPAYYGTWRFITMFTRAHHSVNGHHITRLVIGENQSTVALTHFGCSLPV